MTTCLAFHADPSLAERVKAQVAAHEAADEIIQGLYWENGKGCFIGCLAHGEDVGIVQSLTGFPEMLTRIAEGIFEGLPNDVAKGFPQRVISAPRVGANLSLVAWKFLDWVVKDVLAEFGTPAVREGCAAAVAVVEARASGLEVQPAAARAADADAARTADAAAYAARAAARAADADAAYAAYAAAYAAADAAYAAADAAARAADADARAADADAAYAAADAAAYAAAYAAYAARAARAAAYAAYAARAARAARIRQADKLVELLSAA